MSDAACEEEGSRNYLGEGAARDEGELGDRHGGIDLVLGELDRDLRVRVSDIWPHDLPAPSFDEAVAIWERVIFPRVLDSISDTVAARKLRSADAQGTRMRG